MLSDDYDFAPELDELLQDPLLNDVSGFERFLGTQEAAPQVSGDGQSSASSAEHHSDGSNYHCTPAEASRDRPASEAVDAAPSQPGTLHSS